VASKSLTFAPSSGSTELTAAVYGMEGVLNESELKSGFWFTVSP